MGSKLIISATFTLPDDTLASAKLQQAALEAGAAFQKAIKPIDGKAVYETKIARVRPADAPPITRKKKEPAAPPPVRDPNQTDIEDYLAKNK